FFFDFSCQNRAQLAHQRIPRINAPQLHVSRILAHYAHTCMPGCWHACMPGAWVLARLHAWCLGAGTPGAWVPWCLHACLVPGAWVLASSPGHSITQHLSPAPWFTASLRAFGSTQLLRLVFNSTLARGNPAHLCRFATFLRYCVPSAIVQILSGRDTQAPASPFCPAARGVGRDDLDPFSEKTKTTQSLGLLGCYVNRNALYCGHDY
ncbi:hypothetical protein, partial [Thiolapillus sp.]|uniref:hypothetical protein n=1 Tax=Thiolapillus sp. TaxID=2017437 RepID=UPI003AF9772E